MGNDVRSTAAQATDRRSAGLRLDDALAQQAATGAIMRVMTASPGAVQAVLDAVAREAARLCRAPDARVFFGEGDVLHCVATFPSPSVVPSAPVPVARTSVAGRAVLAEATVHYADILPLLDTEFPDARDNVYAVGFRAILAVPLPGVSGGRGAILLCRSEPMAFTPDQVALVETFAHQAAIALGGARKAHAVSSALDRETATSAVLRVISTSRSDAQPTFETIAGSALRLCDGKFSVVYRFDGELIHIVALSDATPQGAAAFAAAYPCRPSRNGATQRAILTRAVVHMPDVRDDPEYAYRNVADAADYRSVVAVPMLRDGEPIGAISVFREAAGPFPAAQVALLQTFADQAVIAIENVRLFEELERRNVNLVESLEQQTATSDILRVISRSRTDVQPVFDTIAGAVLKLCRAEFCNVFTYDGELIHLAAAVNVNAGYIELLRSFFPRPAGKDTAATRAIASGEVCEVPDVLADADYAGALARDSALSGFRSVLAMPLLREGRAIGAIAVGRPQPGPFPAGQIALLQTFADQAVIAVENVRLFNELRSRTSALTRSVGELRALGEVGQAVSSSLDLEAVLSTIVARAVELTGMDGGSIYEYDEARGEFRLHTANALPDDLVAALRASPIRTGEGVLGRMALAREPVQVHDIAVEGAYQSLVREQLLGRGFRALLAVPLRRDDHLLGGLAVNRKTPGAFAPDVIALLETFAAQSAIAIQNARLFRELEVKGRLLEQASRHKSEFLANMSHELRTPLNAIIGFSEVLDERMFGELNAKQAEYVGDILASGRHLLALINDILDLSKIEAGRLELELADCDVAATVGVALTLVRERAQRRDITLRCEVDAGIGSIRADERKVKQVLLNLLSNALKFTPAGGSVDVSARDLGDDVEIAVKDTGVGIAPEDQAAVFEEFRQVGAVSRRVEGTGLGLAISRKFVELHGGSIRVASELGQGATFAFRLPRSVPENAAPRG
jgi:signal transduction histidine kinase